MKEIKTRLLGDASQIIREMETAQLQCIQRELSGYDVTEQNAIIAQLRQRYGGRA